MTYPLQTRRREAIVAASPLPVQKGVSALQIQPATRHFLHKRVSPQAAHILPVVSNLAYLGPISKTHPASHQEQPRQTTKSK